MIVLFQIPNSGKPSNSDKMDLDPTLLIFYLSSDDNIFRVSILSSPITNFDRVLVLSASKLAVDEYQSEEKKEMVYITA